jgi:hypothetical protein
MHNLIDIIKHECLPRRSCMLTLYDQNNDSAFLYFKEAQLIEVNAGSFWGKDALKMIFSWEIASFDMDELPMGIKRTIWESLDVIIEELVDRDAAQAVGETMRSLEVGDTLTPSSELSSLRDPIQPYIGKLSQVPGFIALYKAYKENTRLLAGKAPTRAVSAEWFAQFTDRVTRLGESLSAGALLEWYLEVNDFRVWRIEIEGQIIYLMSDVQSSPDEFEAGFREVIS